MPYGPGRDDIYAGQGGAAGSDAFVIRRTPGWGFGKGGGTSYGLVNGLGQDEGLTVDQIAVKTMHDLAVRIVDARNAGDTDAEQSLRQELSRVSAIFRGFATEAEKRAAAEEAASFDPLGVKAGATAFRMTGNAITTAAVLGGLGLLLFAMPKRR
ncbi:MAG: hypothetical protein GY906_22875 [bacterium]|nr:hypothetical protein [bacterium]